MFIFGIHVRGFHSITLTGIWPMNFLKFLLFFSFYYYTKRKLSCIINKFVNILYVFPYFQKYIIRRRIEVAITSLTRNQVVGQPARGFESHRLRFLLFSIQKKSCQAGLFLFSKITVDSGQKSVCQNFHGGCGMIGSFVAQLNIYTGYGGVRSLRQIHGHGTAGKDFYAGRP